MTVAPRTPRAVRRDDALSPRQLEVLAFVYEVARDTGIQPSYEEIMTRFGFRSPTAVVHHLKPMALKGWIAKSFNRSRSIQILRRPTGEPFDGFADRPVAGELQTPEIAMLPKLDVNAELLAGVREAEAVRAEKAPRRPVDALVPPEALTDVQVPGDRVAGIVGGPGAIEPPSLDIYAGREPFEGRGIPEVPGTPEYAPEPAKARRGRKAKGGAA